MSFSASSALIPPWYCCCEPQPAGMAAVPGTLRVKAGTASLGAIRSVPPKHLRILRASTALASLCFWCSCRQCKAAVSRAIRAASCWCLNVAYATASPPRSKMREGPGTNTAPSFLGSSVARMAATSRT